MFDWIHAVADEVRIARLRRAELRLYEGLSDRMLRDIGLDRCDIAAYVEVGLRRERRARREAALANMSLVPCG